MPNSAYPLDSPSLPLVSAQPAGSRKGESLVPEQVSQYEEHVGRALGQTTHVVWIPGLAERDIETQVVALGHQAALQVAADAVQHLEFQAVARDLVLCDELADLPDDSFIMGGKRGVNVALQAIAGQFEVIPVHVRLPWEGDRGGFKIRAFAQPDADFSRA